MEITTLLYVVFVLATMSIYYIIPKRYQWIVLLLASLIFYISNSALMIFYMLATALISYSSGIVLNKYKGEFNSVKKNVSREERKILKQYYGKKENRLVTISVVALLMFLVALKYCNFLGGIVNFTNSILHVTYRIPQFNILLPLGISYYTLMSISYVVDVKRGECTAERNIFIVILYLSYFPHIVEGPFDKFNFLSNQFNQEHNFDFDVFRMAVLKILYGFFEKMVVADGLGLFVNRIFDNSDLFSGTGIAIGTVLYTLQIYTDFAGCIDIISGVSLLFGIKVSNNFNQPFVSKSVDEFWRRWHITLGLWLKEYVFYPVGLSSSFKKVNSVVRSKFHNRRIVDFIPVAYSLFFVWFCNGLWHGASVKYIMYGLYYYIIMMIGNFCAPEFDSMASALKIDKNSMAFSRFKICRTFVLVNIGMLLFRSNDLAEFFCLVAKVFTSFRIADVFDVIFYNLHELLIIILGVVIIWVVDLLKEKGVNIDQRIIGSVLPVRWMIYMFLIAIVLVCGIYGVEYGDIGGIYAQF